MRNATDHFPFSQESASDFISMVRDQFTKANMHCCTERFTWPRSMLPTALLLNKQVLGVALGNGLCFVHSYVALVFAKYMFNANGNANGKTHKQYIFGHLKSLRPPKRTLLCTFLCGPSFCDVHVQCYWCVQKNSDGIAY